jgi:hypothetical protein
MDSRKSWAVEQNTMANDGVVEQARMRRFHDAALPHLDSEVAGNRRAAHADEVTE